MLKLISNRSSFQLLRQIHLSSAHKIKEIVVNEDKSNKLITIEGKYLDEIELTKTQVLKLPDDHKTRCVFCKLEKENIYVQYTDVLVLRQFLREDGTVLPKKITGLCKKQQRKLYVLAKHAAIAGLILNLQPPLINGKKPVIDHEKRFEHLKWNTSFDTYENLRRTKKYL
jgi:small subunit ribosomal protein S18